MQFEIHRMVFLPGLWETVDMPKYGKVSIKRAKASISKFRSRKRTESGSEMTKSRELQFTSMEPHKPMIVLFRTSAPAYL